MENEAIRKRVSLLPQEDQKHYQLEDLGHVPYLNLGRLYVSKGMLMHAVKEFELALIVSPGEPVCLAALQHVRKILN